MLMPILARYMTRNPQTIARGATMAEAHRVMRAHQIRHLPVVDGTRVVGVVTLSDLHLLETLPGVSPDEVAVEDAMSSDVYIASASDELPDVVDRMASAKIGSAVVLDADGSLIGIFTNIDALRALADILRREAA